MTEIGMKGLLREVKTVSNQRACESEASQQSCFVSAQKETQLYGDSIWDPV